MRCLAFVHLLVHFQFDLNFKLVWIFKKIQVFSIFVGGNAILQKLF